MRSTTIKFLSSYKCHGEGKRPSPSDVPTNVSIAHTILSVMICRSTTRATEPFSYELTNKTKHFILVRFIYHILGSIHTERKHKHWRLRMVYGTDSKRQSAFALGDNDTQTFYVVSTTFEIGCMVTNVTFHTWRLKKLQTRIHSSSMRTARSSSCLRGGLPQCVLGYTPWVWAWRPPLARPLKLPPGCGPGDLQGMLGYHLQGMLGYPPPCEQNHGHVQKHNLAPTSLQALKTHCCRKCEMLTLNADTDAQREPSKH